MAEPVNRRPLRVGLVGAGTIGRGIVEGLRRQADRQISVQWIYTRNLDKARAWAGDITLFAEIEPAFQTEVDLVVEAAVPDVMRAVVPAFLSRCDVMPFTLTPLADAQFYDALQATAVRAGTRLVLPKGAIVGLDGIVAAKSILAAVSITTIKSPESFGLPATKAGELFRGATRDAVGHFPRNTNVHVAVALAGIGLDRTTSVVVAQAGAKTMRHVIDVKGEGLAWSIGVESLSLGGVSGAFVPLSAMMSVVRRAPSAPGITFE